MWRVLPVLLIGCVEGTELPGEIVAFNIHPQRIATDGTDIYWIDTSADNNVLYGEPLANLPLDRIDLTSFGPGGNVLALDARTVYVSDAESVFALARGGGPPSPIETAPATGITSDGTTLVWCNEGPGAVLHWRPTTTGVTTTVTLPDAALGVVLDGTMVYVRAYRGVYAVNRTTSAVTQLAAAADYESIYADGAAMYSFGLAKNGDHLDWLVAQIGMYADQDRGALVEIPLAGGAPTVVAQDLLAPSLLTVASDGTRYWYESEQNHASLTQGIRRLGPGDTTPTYVIPDVAPSDLTTNGADLYWSTPGSEYDYGEIRRVPLP